MFYRALAFGKEVSSVEVFFQDDILLVMQETFESVSQATAQT